MDPLSASVDESRTDLLPSSSAALFEQFLNERRYLKNVTADTIDWYETAFKAFRRTLNDDAPPITKTTRQSFVVKMRQRNVKPVSVNRDRAELLADLERHFIHKIPPGFKDASKDDGGIGDLLIGRPTEVRRVEPPVRRKPARPWSSPAAS